MMVDLPVGVVHADSLLPQENFDSMRHHTRLVKSGLPVQDNDITVS